jgi:hypothetical protein
MAIAFSGTDSGKVGKNTIFAKSFLTFILRQLNLIL